MSEINLSVNDICLNNDATVAVSGSLIDGLYNLSYTLSGSNTLSVQTSSLTITNGFGTFVIPAAELDKEGSTVLNIDNISFNDGEGCVVSGFGASTSFNIYGSPDIISPTFGITQICQGNMGQIAMFSSNVNTSYQLRLDSDNSTIGLPVAGNGGTINFTISPTITTIYNVIATRNELDGICDGVQIINKPTVTVIPMPAITLTVSANSNLVCQGSGVILTVELTETNVSYQLLDNLVLVPGAVIIGNGSNQDFPEQFPLSTTEYIISAVSTLTESNGSSCSTISLSDHEFVSVEGPIIFTQQPVDQVLCGPSTATFRASTQNTGSGGSLDHQWQVDDGLGGGFIDITGSLHGSVYTNFNTETLDISNTLALTNNSRYLLKSSTSQCTETSNPASLIISTAPDTSGMSVAVTDVCIGLDGTATFTTPNLANGKYNIRFDITGANTANNIDSTLTISSNTGELIIPSSILPNLGNNALQIASVNYIGGQSCSVNVTGVSSPFVVNPLPDTSNLLLDISDICIGSNATTKLSTRLSADTYNIKYSLDGGNIALDEIGTVTISTDGTGEFTVSNTLLLNAGTTTLEITQVSYDNATACSVPSLSYKNSFEIIANPDAVTPIANDVTVCFGDRATVSLDNSELGIGYQLRYESDDTPIGNVVVGNGNTISLYDTPSTTTNYNIYAQSVKLGTTCTGIELINKVSIIVIPTPSNALAVVADQSTVCIGDNVTIQVNSSANDVSYQLYEDNVIIAGATFVGTGSNQTFIAQSPQVSTTYTVIASPVTLDFANELCAGVLLLDNELVTVEGPIDFTSEPKNQTLCGSGATTFSTSLNNNGSGGSPNLIWRVDAGGGFEDINGTLHGSVYTDFDKTILQISKHKCIGWVSLQIACANSNM